MDNLETLQDLAHVTGDRRLFAKLLEELSKLPPAELSSEKTQQMRADCYYCLQRWEDLVRLCKCLSSTQPSLSKEFAVGYAHALARLGNHRDALDVVEEYKERWPKCPRLQIFMAQLRWELGDNDQAKRELERYYLIFEKTDDTDRCARHLSAQMRESSSESDHADQ